MPESWAMNIVSARSYGLADADDRRLWEGCTESVASSLLPGAADPQAARYGKPVLLRPRLGQGGYIR